MTVTPADAQWQLRVQSVAPASPAWSFSAWPGMYSDAADEDDLPDVVMADTASVLWAFTDGQIPAQLEPSTVTFTLWARSVLDLPTNLQRGGWCKWDVTLYPYSATPVPFYVVSGGHVSEADLELRPDSRWKARLTVKAVDLLADLSSLAPALNAGEDARISARARIIQICNAMGVGVAIPSAGIPNDGDPYGAGNIAGGRRMAGSAGWGSPAREQLAMWCNGNQSLNAAIITPWYDPNGALYPNGYAWPGTGLTWWQTALPQTLSPVKYCVTSSAKPAPTKLPLRLGVTDGELRLSPAPATESHAAAVDAGVVDVPGRVRSGREHAPNVFRWQGTAEGSTGTEVRERAATYDYAIADAASTGPRVRSLPTLLTFATWDPNNQDNGNTFLMDMTTVTSAYAPDGYALAVPWAFDAIVIHVDRMTEAETRSVVPKLSPSYPTAAAPVASGADGQLIRHVTLYNLDPDVLPPDGSALYRLPQGYVTSGRFKFEEGKMTAEVTMTPGASPASGSRITVGDVDAASWHANPAGNIDRSIRVADLALVDA